MNVTPWFRAHVTRHVTDRQDTTTSHRQDTATSKTKSSPTLQTSNVDNMYVNTYFVCKSVAMITCMLYSDATSQVRCNGVTATCNVAMKCNVATAVRCNSVVVT